MTRDCANRPPHRSQRAELPHWARRADQHRGARRVPVGGYASLVQVASATKPAPPPQLGTRTDRLVQQWLPRARIVHPWPQQRFAAEPEIRNTRNARAAQRLPLDGIHHFLHFFIDRGRLLCNGPIPGTPNPRITSSTCSASCGEARRARTCIKRIAARRRPKVEGEMPSFACATVAGSAGSDT